MESFQDKIFSEILDTAKNIESSNNNDQEETVDTYVDLKEFCKIIYDFLRSSFNFSRIRR